jgi:HlyD family secretion protein
MNPDLKVYLTTISIDGSQDWLKPGMTAKVEIMINRLSDVVHVPVQCVVTENGEQVCYMARNGSAGRRVVTTGEFNDEFIVVKTGLQEGDSILLRPPSSAATTEKKTGKTPPANEVKPATKDAKPVAAKK